MAGARTLALPAALWWSVAATAAPAGAAGARSDAPVDRQSEIAPRIIACWHPPAEGDEITLRLSFRADGTLFGKPRITYVKAVGGADGEAALANSIFEAIQDCGPLRFTPALGAVVAGRLFLIRFIAPRKGLRAAL